MVLGIKSIEELPLEGKRVFMRVDFNVPLDDEGDVADESRIRAALPSIKYVREQGGRLILASHLGRPKGKVDKALSLEPVAMRLAEILETEVILPDDCTGEGVRNLALNLREGQIMVLENLRFHQEETSCDEAFARAMAANADVYINDAFGTAHRRHASVFGVPKHIPVKGAGYLMFKELENLGKLVRSPKRPFVAVLGGAKVADKIGVIQNLLGLVDVLLIGGAMANTFLAARDIDLGASMVEEDQRIVAKRILAKAEDRGVKLVLPTDLRAAEEITDDADTWAYPARGFPKGKMALDIGPETISLFEGEIRLAKTIFWNGPMGVFERTPFKAGTEAVANAIANAAAYSVIGGGDSLAAVQQSGVTPFISHISTGGGASLKFLEGKDLPGIVALR